jgi:hypothetical protein
MPTDVFTKSLFIAKHYHCLQKIGMVIIPPDFQLFLAIEPSMSLLDTTGTSQTQLPTIPHIQAFMAHVEGSLKSYKLSLPKDNQNGPRYARPYNMQNGHININNKHFIPKLALFLGA